MATPPVRQNRTENGAENIRAGETTRDLLASLGAPFLSGVALTFDAPAAADVRVPHRLGRRPRGWMVTDATVAAPSLYRASWDETVITFTSGAAATITLWVW